MVYGFLWNLLVRRLNKRGMRVIVEEPPNVLANVHGQPTQYPRRVWEPITQK